MGRHRGNRRGDVDLGLAGDRVGCNRPIARGLASSPSIADNAEALRRITPSSGSSRSTARPSTRMSTSMRAPESTSGSRGRCLGAPTQPLRTVESPSRCRPTGLSVPCGQAGDRGCSGHPVPQARGTTPCWPLPLRDRGRPRGRSDFRMRIGKPRSALRGCRIAPPYGGHSRTLAQSGPFDEVFRSERIRIVKTPVRSPKANAIAERFVRTVRGECLDWLLILNRRHLEHVLRVYADHYNCQRPHRALDLRPPNPGNETARPALGEIPRHDRLGGLIHEYHRAAA